MRRPGRTLLCALLASAPQERHLLQYLPDELAHEVQSCPLPESPRLSGMLSQKGWSDSIHYSWFLEPLQSVPAASQRLFLSLLSDDQVRALRSQLSAESVSTPYSPFMHPFLTDELKKLVQRGIDVVTIDQLPPSDLNILLSLDREHLLSLIDLLGICDLSVDLRQIIDKKVLRMVYGSLSNRQLHFLHHCLKQPIKWISPPLNLLKWDGSKRTLQRMLHRRGLVRLGCALFNEDESMKWHLLHRLDTGRARIVEHTLRGTQKEARTPYFKRQVLSLINRYQL